MVALPVALSGDQAAADLVEPLLLAKLGGLDSVPDFGKPGVDPPDHIFRLVAKLSGNRIQAHGLPAVKGLEAGRA